MNSQKHLFSLRENVHYFNNAYKAPLLKSAEEACVKALIRERNPMDITVDTCYEEMPIVKDYFGQLVNAKGSQVAIMPSSSYGFSSALNNTDAKLNGNAVTISDEFPSGYFALKKWCLQHENELIAVEPGDDNLIGRSWNENVLKQINEQTSLVLLSSIHWMNGIKFDLEKIGAKCKEVGAKFIVDGTQSVGALEMDVQKFQIDVLICAGYKWLMGPYSMALAYFGDAYSDGIPIEESWMNRSNAREFSNLTEYEEEYQPDAGRYNVGQTSNYILMPIIRESMRQLIEWSPNNIQQYCAHLIQPLITFLKEMGIEFEPEAYFCSHLFSLQLPENIDIDILKENLTKNQIYLSVRGKYLRLAVNVFNDEADVQKLIEVIKNTVDENQ